MTGDDGVYPDHAPELGPIHRPPGPPGTGTWNVRETLNDLPVATWKALKVRIHLTLSLTRTNADAQLIAASYPTLDRCGRDGLDGQYPQPGQWQGLPVPNGGESIPNHHSSLTSVLIALPSQDEQEVPDLTQVPQVLGRPHAGYGCHENSSQVYRSTKAQC